MILFPTVVALGDARVHVSHSDGGNMSTEIEEVINKKFCLGITLSVSNVKPDNSHIGLGGGFDDSGFGGQGNIFE